MVALRENVKNFEQNTPADIVSRAQTVYQRAFLISPPFIILNSAVSLGRGWVLRLCARHHLEKVSPKRCLVSQSFGKITTSTVTHLSCSHLDPQVLASVVRCYFRDEEHLRGSTLPSSAQHRIRPGRGAAVTTTKAALGTDRRVPS